MTLSPGIKAFFIKKTARLIINSIIMTCRIRVRGEENIRSLKKKNVPIIFTFWHRHIFFTIFRFKKTGARPLISRSADGELVSRVAEEFGMRPVRGSSSSGGARAFLKLVESIKTEKSDILITADGPKGPVRQLKDGTILLAQKTGSIIVPICWHASRVKILKKTWDQFVIPLPFSEITFSYGQPFRVPGKDGNRKSVAGMQELKEELQRRMNQLERETERIYEKNPAVT
jgi:lysophospholipid acyltransferase (LPLAT)-like uncharacterized protein